MVMRVNIRNADKLELDGEAIDEVETSPILAVTSARIVNLIGTYR